MTSFEDQLRENLDSIAEKGLLRRVTPLKLHNRGTILVRDREYLNLAGNDYLGLAGDRELVSAFYADLNKKSILEQYGPGSGASRLMTGNHALYAELEEQLSRLYSTERALIFNSGYHINIGLLPALAGRQDLIVADKLCHASLIDGMRLTRATVIRYPHLDYNALETLLKQKRGRYRNVFLVTESIFSMDGDTADLKELVRLKNRFDTILYVDEAHGVGMMGENGLGLAEEQGVLPDIDLLVGTFGKACGSQGAFVACSQVARDYLLNTTRSFIFTTALPPVIVHWLGYIIRLIPGMKEKRQRVREMAEQLRRELRNQGLITDGSTHIVPVMIGDAERAMQTAEQLRGKGYWTGAVRPPTVPAKTARLRLSITAAMDWDRLAPLPALIAETLS